MRDRHREGFSFPLAIIHAEQDKTYLKRRLREGRIKPLKPAPPFDAAVIDRAERIVGMVEAEPYLRALTREVVAARYGLPADEVKFFIYDNALAFKASIPRPNFQGDLLDSDNHGGQPYAPLMDTEIPGL